LCNCADDWVGDDYRWVNSGTDKLPRRKPIIYKRKFQTICKTDLNVGSRAFRRFTYHLLVDPTHILVQYVGDESAAVELKHGNAKDEDADPHRRAVPSLLRNLEKETGHTAPSVVHKTAIAGASHVTDVPRNFKQVDNARTRVLAASRLSNDSLVNLHDVAYDLPQFMWVIQTFPDLIVVGGRNDLIAEVNNFLAVHGKTNTQVLSYDTTFSFGEFYVSVLLVRGVCFKENPVIPVMFMIHERKLKSTHNLFVNVVSEKIPLSKSSSCVLVTDGEAAFNVFEETFPKMTHLYCYNHVLTDVKHWVLKHNGTSTDVTVYVDHVRMLLHAQSVSDYEELYKELARKWSKPFCEYYAENIHKYVGVKLGRSLLEGLNCYSEVSGITQNASEGFNTVMRRMMDWKEAPVDTFVLVLYHLQGFYVNMVRLGRNKRGDYHLLDQEFPRLRLSDDAVTLEKTIRPEELVKEMKERRERFIKEKEGSSDSQVCNVVVTLAVAHLR